MKTPFLSALLGCALSAAAPAAAAARQAPAVAEERPLDELIAAGRAALAEGRPEEGLALLEQAAARDASFATRRWLLSAWIANGRVNDALDATDDARRAGAPEPDLDYLYGLAFRAKALQHLAQSGGQMIEMNFRDAVEYLRSATEAAPDIYWDGHVALAEAAWYARELDVARAAAERAVARRPEGARELFQLGRVAFSQFSAAHAAGDAAAEADAHWQAAYDAFQRTAAAIGTPPADDETGLAGLLAQAHLQSAYALQWKERGDEADAEYAAAMGSAPGVVDYGQLWSSLGRERFLAVLEQGEAHFARRHDAQDPADATLQWWLGFARFEGKDYEGCEAPFRAALAKWPAYANSRWYVALALYHRGEYREAIDELVAYREEAPEALTASLAEDPELNLAIVDYLVGQCVEQERTQDAAVLSEAQAYAAPGGAQYWNNAGLFWRDAGDELRGGQHGPNRGPEVMALYERAYTAYSKALAISPEDPSYLNDTAVVLDYCLDRELGRALEMYARARVAAERELAREDLDEDTRAVYRVALRDSRNNHRRLAARLERQEERKEKQGGS